MADKRVNIVIRARDTAGKALDGVKSRLLSIRNIIGAGIGLVALNRGLKETVGRAASAEAALKRLAVAMKSAGRFSADNSKHFERMAVDLERTTGFLEEDVLEALAVLQTFGQMTREDMDATIVASLNMATIFNEDLTQAAIRLGKAYNGQLIGLQRMGVLISKTTFNAEGFSAVLKQLAIEQGGQAVSRMKGFEGALNSIKVGFGEVGKEVGKFATLSRGLNEVMRILANGFQITARWIRRKREAEQKGLSVISQYIDLTKRQAGALDGLAKSHVIVEIANDLREASRQTRKIQEELKELSALDLFGVEEQAIRKRLIESLKTETKLRQQLKALAGDKQVVRGLREEADLITKVTKKSEERTTAEINAAQKRKDAIFEAQNFFKESLDMLDQLRKEAKEDEDDLETDKLNALFENLKKRADIVKAFLGDETNAVLDNAKRQLSILDDLTSNKQRRETDALREVLKADQLNQSERELLLDKYAEKVEQINERIKGAKTPEELKTLTDQLNQIRSIFAGIADTETISSALIQAQAAADLMIDTFSKMDFEQIFDLSKAHDSLIRQSKEAADLIRRTIQDDLDSTPIKIPVTVDRDSYLRGG